MFFYDRNKKSKPKGSKLLVRNSGKFVKSGARDSGIQMNCVNMVYPKNWLQYTTLGVYRGVVAEKRGSYSPL